MLHRRFPKLFSNNNNKSKQDMDSKSNPSTPTQPTPKRLNRTKAAKNIDYYPTPPPTTSSSSSSSSILFSSDSNHNSFAVHTRSIDVYPWGDRTSFRIDGKQEADFDLFCKSLGISSPDDFGISPQDYDAMKASSSPIQLQPPHVHHISDYSTFVIDPTKDFDVNVTFDAKLYRAEVEDGRGEIDDLNVSFDAKLYRAEVDDGRGEIDLQGLKVVRSTCVGIKGERPPAVLLSSPLLNQLDNLCSSFDIHAIATQQDESTSEDEGQHATQGPIIQQLDDQPITRGQETGLLSVSSSFTSNSNDDDSSSTTTDPMSISPNGRLTRQISSWDKGKHLGSGSYGSVYEGIADGGFFFAVKEVSLLDQGDKGREIIYQFEQEMAFLSQFQHKNIVRYLGTDKDDSNLYIFLELVPQGSLLSLYQRFRFQDSHVSVYTRQILEGLKYLHERNVVHRDIKCANILLDVDGYVKLADFGLAKVAKLNDAKSCKGTSYWMAPEVVKPNQWYGRAADIWSLGCTVLEMLTQNFPYHPLDGYQAMFKIGRGQPPPVPDFLSRDARDFILKCLQVDPDTRPSAADLLEHPFVKPHSTSASTSPHHHGIRA